MDKKKWIVVLAVLLAIGLAGCLRSATGPVVSETQPASDFDAIISVGATLTAQAAGAGAQATTDTGGVVTVTPTAPALLATATATATPTLLPTQDLVVPDTYTLHKGEFPYCIARRFNIDITTLLNANGLSPNTVVYAGLKLTIPQNGGSFNGQRALKPHPAEYTVQSGDTVYSIACQFGDVWPESIAQVNGFDIDDPLTVGDVLQIP